MTCKDCVYYEACKMILLSAYPNVTEAEIIQTANNQTKCVNFKDKTRFVELPCKVGDTIYKICLISNRLKIGDMWDGRKVKTDCDRCAWRNCDCHDIGYQKDCLNIVHPIKMKNEINILKCKKYFGQIYFLTPEEAEEKLKEIT